MAARTAELTLEAANRRFDGAPPKETIAWAADHFGDGIVLAASFNDCVLIDLVARTAPQVPVVFLDTQYHFIETLEYVERVRVRYGLTLEVVRPLVAPDERWRTDTDGCCAARKVEPLGRALRNRTAWISGLRRAESPTRRTSPAVSWDSRWQAAKVNPIVHWSDTEVAAYKAGHELPEHPLVAQGYRSIGCWPCTTPTAAAEDPRAGRWAGSDKLECGLHVASNGTQAQAEVS
jgi:phosphoadenosine phosphosulfate reductase